MNIYRHYKCKLLLCHTLSVLSSKLAHSENHKIVRPVKWGQIKIQTKSEMWWKYQQRAPYWNCTFELWGDNSGSSWQSKEQQTVRQVFSLISFFWIQSVQLLTGFLPRLTPSCRRRAADPQGVGVPDLLEAEGKSAECQVCLQGPGPWQHRLSEPQEVQECHEDSALPQREPAQHRSQWGERARALKNKDKLKLSLHRDDRGQGRILSSFCGWFLF